MPRDHQKKKRIKTKIISAALGILLLCMSSGCGSKAAAPELIEPVSRSDLYRPVERGKIESVKVLTASVAPTQYAQFFETEMELLSIPVHIGDVVEAGDVLAYVDISYAQEQLDALNAQLSQEQECFRINERIADCRIQETYGIRQQFSQAEEPDADMLADYDVQIAVLQEDLRYDTLLYQYRIGKLEESIAVLEEIVSSGELRASHGGTVTYLKDITTLYTCSTVSAYENVAVVSDLADCYLELDEITVDKYEYEDYEGKYVVVDGAQYEVTEISFSSEELIACKAAGEYPYVRMTLPEGADLGLGERYMIRFSHTNMEEVLMVGNDSLYTDGEQNFVYVKSENQEKEKRVVATGAADDLYTEITEGLSEGEQVYYSTQESPPEDYKTCSAELSDFNMEVSVFPKGVLCIRSGAIYHMDSETNVVLKNMAGGTTHTYSAEVSGTIVELTEHMDGEQVQKGEMICCVDTGIGNAALTEQQYKIDAENRSYQKTLRSYEEQEKELKESGMDALTLAWELKILEYQRELSGIIHEAALSGLEAEYEKMEAGNDGTGKVYIYAEESGIISFRGFRGNKDTRIEEGDFVSEGEQIFYITEPKEDQVSIMAVGTAEISSLYANKKVIKGGDDYGGTPSPILEDGSKTANIGQEITIVSGGESYTVSVSGIGGGTVCNSRVYLTETEKDYVISHNRGISAGLVYADPEDAAFPDSVDAATFSWNFLSLKNALLIPADCVYQGRNSSGRTVNYVWRVADGELIKQYISVSQYYISIGSGGQVFYLVFSGLQAGDVLAYENE